MMYITAMKNEHHFMNQGMDNYAGYFRVLKIQSNADIN